MKRILITSREAPRNILSLQWHTGHKLGLLDCHGKGPSFLTISRIS